MQRLIILTFIILIYSANGFSCDCDGDYSYDSEFYHCDVVLSGKILSVHNQTKDSYTIKVEINSIFKGDSISEFLVYSIPDNFEVIENGDTLIYMSDCDIYLRVGEEWLIYADKNSNGKYGLGFCSATKKLDEAVKAELNFLNYNKNLVISDNTIFYPSNELDNPELISLSIRGYSMIINNSVEKETKKEEYKIGVKIDKNGYVISDSLNSVNYKTAIKEMKELEPFIPGTKDGQIVNSVHTIIVKSENPPPPRPSSHMIDSIIMDKETEKELEKELRDE